MTTFDPATGARAIWVLLWGDGDTSHDEENIDILRGALKAAYDLGRMDERATVAAKAAAI